MDKLSFKQYINTSKCQLLSAINNIPVVKNHYKMNKYCTLVLEQEEELTQVSLKPTHNLLIEWRYDNPDNPSIVSICVDNHDIIDNQDKYNTPLTTEKMKKWLLRNTTKKDI